MVYVALQVLLCLANDSSSAQILRYDLQNKVALPPIQGQAINKIGQAWNRLYDLSIHNDRLYTASLSSNRVDVFDISSTEPQFITSLGTGSWSGDQTNKAIVHALSVTANDQYVFAADIQNRINVWKQADVTAANHLNAVKHARLVLPGCGSTYCDVRLEAADQLLFASLGNGQTYVYDIANIPAGSSNIQPIKQQSNTANIFNYADDGLLYASRTSGRVDSFNIDAVKNATAVLPNAIDNFQSYQISGQATAYKFSQATDIFVSQQRLFNLANATVTILPLKNLSQYQSNQNASSTQQLTLNSAIHQTRILQDGESWETLTNYNLRNFYMNRILSGTINKNTLNLQSYSAIPVSDLEIQVKMKNTDQWFVLAKLNQLDAFSQTQFNLNIQNDQRYPLVDGAKSIYFTGLNEFEAFPSDLFDIRIQSKTDTHVQKLSNLKPAWNIAFGKYGVPADASWKPINPLYAREWVIMMTNFAYIISSPEFNHIWFNHKTVMGHDFFGNAGQVTGTNGIFTTSDYTTYYDAIMNRDRIDLGVTSMGGGLGGGTVLGIDTWIFYAHYFNTDVGIIGHEFGHHFGSHDSAWANSSYGLQPVNQQLHQYFQRKNELPYMDPDVNKFHLSPADQRYNGIDQGMRVPRPANQENKIEAYFKANPL